MFARRLVADDPETVAAAVAAWLDDPGCDAVVTTGGTGIAPRDRTYEAVADLIDQRLDGFGELFRALSLRGDRQRRDAQPCGRGDRARQAAVRASGIDRCGAARDGAAGRSGARAPGVAARADALSAHPQFDGP